MSPCLLDWFSTSAVAETVLRAEPLRAIARPLAAAALSLVAVLVLGRLTVPWLRRWMVMPGESDSATLNRLHEHKRSTPTMGGLFVIAAILLAIAAVADLRQPNVQAALVILIGFAALGAVDDLLKCRAARRGLSARWKFSGQLLIAAAAALWLHGTGGIALSAVVATLLWIVATSNAVNLTDGLDGLAAGCVFISAAAIGLLAPSTETQVLAAALAGSTLGFLRFNRRPASVFLGDSGALPLGALLALLMVNVRAGWICLIIGGVFVVELLSVVLQVGWFKLSGMRLFRCAPLHHHFQFAGWQEDKIVQRFWIAAGACAAIGITAGIAAPTGGMNHFPPEIAATNGVTNQISETGLRITPRANSPNLSAAEPNFSPF